MQTQRKNCQEVSGTVQNCPVCFVSLRSGADFRLSQITKNLDILQSKKNILISLLYEHRVSIGENLLRFTGASLRTKISQLTHKRLSIGEFCEDLSWRVLSAFVTLD